MTLHANNLSPAEAERLAMLAEECGEVVQAIGKILRHGWETAWRDKNDDLQTSNNRADLLNEVTDLLTTVHIMNLAKDIPPVVIGTTHIRRRLRYSHHQEDVLSLIDKAVVGDDPSEAVVRSCDTCRHRHFDMDGFYCTHPKAMAQSPLFGLSMNAMARIGLCIQSSDTDASTTYHLWEPVK